jgi:DNA-binding SARP family transcriptional activator
MSGRSGGFEDASGAIPGDPEQLRAVGRNYSVMADELDRQGDALRQQVIANWEGDAAAGWDSYRQRASRNYLDAAQTARDSAAVVATRAQSIEDNRCVAADAAWIKDNATRASEDTSRDSPAWQNHEDELRAAEAKLASAQAADEQSAADTTTQASALHQQLPATRLLADSSPLGDFDIVTPAAAPAPPVPSVAAPIAPPGVSAPDAGPGLAPRAVPQPRTAPPPGPAGGGAGGGGGTGAGTGGGTGGASNGDGGRSHPSSGGSADKNGGRSGGSAPGGVPDLGDASPTTNPAGAAPSAPSLGGRNPIGGSTPGAGTPSPQTPNLNSPSVFGAGAGAGRGPYPTGGYGGRVGATGTGGLPWSSRGYAPRPVFGQSGYIAQELGGPRGWSPATGLDTPAGSGPAGSAGSGVLPPTDSPVPPPAGAPARVTEPGASPRSPTSPGEGQKPPVASDPPALAPPVSVPGPGDQGTPGGVPGGGQNPPTVPPDNGTEIDPNAPAGPGAPANPSGGPSSASRTAPGAPPHSPGTHSPSPTGSGTSAGHLGVAITAATVVAAGTAAALVHAHRKVQIKQRRDYRAGSGRRDVLPTPPAVRAMVRAHHTNPHRHDPHRDPYSDLVLPTGDTQMPATPDAGAPQRPGLVPAVVPLGMRDGRPVMLNFGAGTVAFTGLGASDAVRSLITSTVGGIRDGRESSTDPGRCILGDVEAGELFGPHHEALPPGIIITDGLTASLAAATALADRLSPDWQGRAGEEGQQTGGDDPTGASPLDDGPVLLIVNAMRPAQLQAVRVTLARLTAAGVGVVILGEHPEGRVCEVNATHVVASAYGPATEHLHAAVTNRVAIHEIEDFLSPLTANSPTAADTSTGSIDERDADEIDDLDQGEDTDESDSGWYSPRTDRGHDPHRDHHGDASKGAPAASPRVSWFDGLIREIGTRAGHGLTYDLGAFPGLGVTGPGASAFVCALWIRLLNPSETDPSLSAAEVVIPIETADALLGEPDLDPNAPADAEEVQVLGWPGEVDDLDAALSELEREIIARGQAHYDTLQVPDTASGLSRGQTPIVLITHSPEEMLHRLRSHHAHSPVEPASASAAPLDDHQSPTPATLENTSSPAVATQWAARLREVSERGAAVGIGVLVLGPWTHGTTCDLDIHGNVRTATGAGRFLLRQATLHQLDAPTIRDFLNAYQPPSQKAIAAEVIGEEAIASEVIDEPIVDPDVLDSSQLGDADATGGRAAASTDHESMSAGPAGQIPPRTGAGDGDRAGRSSQGTGADWGLPTEESERRGEHTSTASTTATVVTPSATEPIPAVETGERSRPITEPTTEPAAEPRTGDGTMDGAVLAATEPLPVPAPPSVAAELDGAPAEALLAVLVLGPLAVFARSAPGEPWREITGRLSPSLRLLLAALAASTQPVHLEALVAMCLPGEGGDAAAHRLRNQLSRLRTILRQATGLGEASPLIAYTAGRYHFTETCWVDNHALHTQLRTTTGAATAAAEATEAGEADAARWAAAFALYRGPLLADMEYDADTEWLAPHREHTLRTMIDLADRLADHLAATSPGRAAGYLSDVLRLDPYNEDIAYRLIVHHLAHDQRRAAHQVLTQLTAHLTEIEETPRPATLALLHDPRLPSSTS